MSEQGSVSAPATASERPESGLGSLLGAGVLAAGLYLSPRLAPALFPRARGSPRPLAVPEGITQPECVKPAQARPKRIIETSVPPTSQASKIASSAAKTGRARAGDRARAGAKPEIQTRRKGRIGNT